MHWREKQRWRGLFISTQEDRVLESGRYETADELLQRQAESALVIQKNWRRRQAQVLTRRMRSEREAAEKQEASALERRNRLTRLLESERKKRCEDPQSQADFALLLAQVGSWRQLDEHSDGRSTKTQSLSESPGAASSAKRERRLSLLRREVEVLNRLSQMRSQASRRNERERQELLLRQMRQPLLWLQQDGGTALVYTPETQRAVDLEEIYLQLRDNKPRGGGDAEGGRSSSPEFQGRGFFSAFAAERMRVLQSAIAAVKEYASAAELLELLQRELVLLERKCPAALLKGLRQRITREFFCLLLNPEFNPRASAVTKVALV